MEKKVLVVADDEEMNRRVIKRFLKSKFEVLEAENGRQVIEILEKRSVDALLLDIIMPKMDGLEVLEYLKNEKKFRQMGILVATSTKEKTERRALSLGADDVVSKPYDPIVIQKRLENILVMKEAQREKQLLQRDGVEAVLGEQRVRFVSKLEDSAEKLHKIADLICLNKENEKLVKEMAQEIHKETDLMMHLFLKEN